MKKKLIIAIAAIVVIAAVLLIVLLPKAPATPKSLAGTTWVCTLTEAQLKEMHAPDGTSKTISLVFTDETHFTTKMVTSVNGEEMADEEEDTYTYKDGKLTIEDGGDAFAGTVTGDTITMQDGDLKLVFKKK